MNKASSKIIEFAHENGYDGAIPLGKWRGYDAYEPIFGSVESPTAAHVGPPLMILVKEDEIRMSTVEEAYEQIRESND